MARSASVLQLVRRMMTAFDNVELGRSVRVCRGVSRPRFKDGEVAVIREAARVHRVCRVVAIVYRQRKAGSKIVIFARRDVTTEGIPMGVSDARR